MIELPEAWKADDEMLLTMAPPCRLSNGTALRVQ